MKFIFDRVYHDRIMQCLDPHVDMNCNDKRLIEKLYWQQLYWQQLYWQQRLQSDSVMNTLKSSQSKGRAARLCSIAKPLNTMKHQM